MSVGRTGCTLVVLGQSSHEVALRAALEPPHGHRKYILIFFDFIQWKPTDTWPRDRCGRAQLVLLPSLADFLHLGADL